MESNIQCASSSSLKKIRLFRRGTPSGPGLNPNIHAWRALSSPMATRTVLLQRVRAPFFHPRPSSSPRLLDIPRLVTRHSNLRCFSTSASSGTSTTPHRNMNAVLEQQQHHAAGDWYSVPDLRLRDHRFTVPLDHTSPSSHTISVFAREVVAGTCLISRILSFFLSFVLMMLLGASYFSFRLWEWTCFSIWELQSGFSLESVLPLCLKP